MIRRYEAVWPSHPFAFHVPYQRQPLEGPRIVPRRTPSDIRPTVLGLLEGFDDETWVYWCIDDKYPVGLVQPPVSQLAEAIRREQLPAVDGLLFCRCRRLLLPWHLRGEKLEAPGGIVLLRRRDYSQIWIHQFLRVKVLRQLFLRLPETVPAMALDALKDRLALPMDHRLYVVGTNLSVFGESTLGGRVTGNCATSLRALGLGVPGGFEELDLQLLMGNIDTTHSAS
jgi:hypothetical protein